MIKNYKPLVGQSHNGDPEIQLSCVSNMYVRMMNFKHSGDIENGHSHPFDHLTLLSYGSAIVEVDGFEKHFDAPSMIFIKKNKVHKITSTVDNTLLYCIHAIRDGGAIEDIIDPEQTIIPTGIDGVGAISSNKTLRESLTNEKFV